MSRASIGDYVVTSKLGSGSFAVVYKGYHKTSKVPVAIKAMSLSKLNSKLLANLETEIAIMRQIDHPNVVKLYEIKKTEKHIYLILEYCAGGDLQQYMRRQDQKAAAATGASTITTATAVTTSSVVGVALPAKRERLSEAVAHHFLQELAKGMLCLWSHNLIHRDLKPQNLLLVEDSPTSALKIADFGFARHLATASLAETLCGSPLYMAPEILKFQKYDAKADLWSVGTILFEMVVGKPPYGGSNHVQLLANIERTDLRFPPNVELSDACKSLLLGLLQRKPVTRMGFDDFFQHPFVGLREHLSQSALALSASRSATAAASASASMSIREEDEDAEDDCAAAVALVATAEPSGHTKERAASESLDSPSPSSSALRQSRSGNMEVMQTAFGSTSSAGSAALRRSSRLGRSRRATSSGALLGNPPTTSPKLSPQMSPHMLPSPSPRINPFKQMAESAHFRVSGASAAAAATSAQSSQRASRAAPSMSTSASTSAVTGARVGKNAGSALDSSDEYVLVESGSEKAATMAAPSTRESAVHDRVVAVHQPSTSSSSVSTRGDAPVAHPLRAAAPFAHEYGQQLVDIVMLRAQAIAPIAEQLWRLSTAASGNSSVEPSQRESTSSGANLASMFSIESSLSSSSGGPAAASSGLLDCDDDRSALLERRQYACAAEALALYVKCLRIVQHGIAYLRQDPATGTKRLTATAPATTPVLWSEASRKLSMAYLTEQLNVFLDRAEQCRQRMASVATSADAAAVRECERAVVSPDELLYTHALRLGQQGAVKEVLGQTRLAYERYLQAMLLLESLLMDTPTATAASATAMAVDDQKCVNAFLRALDERLQNVKRLLDGGDDGAKQSAVFDQQLAPLMSGGPP